MRSQLGPVTCSLRMGAMAAHNAGAVGLVGGTGASTLHMRLSGKRHSVALYFGREASKT